MDVQNKIYELFGANRHFVPFEKHLQILYSNTIILLHGWVLNLSRIPGISNL
jgi:hypothetical protein